MTITDTEVRPATVFPHLVRGRRLAWASGTNMVMVGHVHRRVFVNVCNTFAHRNGMYNVVEDRRACSAAVARLVSHSWAVVCPAGPDTSSDPAAQVLRWATETTPGAFPVTYGDWEWWGR